MNESIRFEYVQEAYDDEDVYIPANSVAVLHNAEDHGTLQEIVDSFKQFLIQAGWPKEFIEDRIQLVEGE